MTVLHMLDVSFDCDSAINRKMLKAFASESHLRPPTEVMRLIKNLFSPVSDATITAKHLIRSPVRFTTLASDDKH